MTVDPDYAAPDEMLARYYQDRSPGRSAYYLDDLKRLGNQRPRLALFRLAPDGDELGV